MLASKGGECFKLPRCCQCCASVFSSSGRKYHHRITYVRACICCDPVCRNHLKGRVAIPCWLTSTGFGAGNIPIRRGSRSAVWRDS